MFLQSLQFEDKIRGWKLEETRFSDLNLLVGVSGVGKTQILEAIRTLQKIAFGDSFDGIAWDAAFKTSDGKSYRWLGEFEPRPYAHPDGFFGNGTKRHTAVKFETVSVNGKVVVERTSQTIKLHGRSIPKLTPHNSILTLLPYEPDVHPALDGFGFILLSNPTGDFGKAAAQFRRLQETAGQLFDSLDNIRMLAAPTSMKLLLVHEHQPRTFRDIATQFIDVFPQVEDVRIQSIPRSGATQTRETEEFVFQIKEIGSDPWIDQDKISAGMMKAFLFISDLHLSPDGTVILIDEFENGLGVNCIGAVTDLLFSGNRRFQFIITSHHPYVINNINPKYWKLVTRRGGIVKTQDVKDLNLPKSHHQAFLQLINLEQFENGIAAP